MKRLLLYGTGSIVAGVLIGYCVSKQAVRFSVALTENAPEDRERELPLTDSQVSEMLVDATAPKEGFGDQATICYVAESSDLDFPDLRGNTSAMAKFLAKPLYLQLSRLRTSYGGSIDQCIQVGVDYPSRETLGILATDEECYTVFAPLFLPVIKSYHPAPYLARESCVQLGDLGIDFSVDAISRKVKMHSFTMKRSISGFRYPPTSGRAERRQVEDILQRCFKLIQAEFGGGYKAASSSHLSHSDDKFIRSIAEPPQSTAAVSSGFARDWPFGRGIYKSKDGEILSWTNKFEHLEVSLRSQSKDIYASFEKIWRFMQKMNSSLEELGFKFAFQDDIGFLTADPRYCGTTLLASVHVQLPLLIKDVRLKGILRTHRLRMNPLSKGLSEISNRDMLHASENQIVQNMIRGVGLLIIMEERLEKKLSINDLLIEPQMQPE